MDNMLTINLQLFALHREFKCNILFYTHHIKMVLLRERITKGFSPQFWEESISCASFIVNHIPTNTLKDNSLEESWIEIKLDVSHFHVFGSEAWT